MEGDRRVSDEIFCHEVSEVIGANIARLCVDVILLNNMNLCSFMDFANNDSKFQVTMAQVLRDVSDSNICEEMDGNIGNNQVDAVTLLLRLTRSSVIFKCKTEISRRIIQRRISIEMFRDVALHSEEYRLLDNLKTCNTTKAHFFTQRTNRHRQWQYWAVLPISQCFW